MRNGYGVQAECWVTKSDHEQEAIEKAIFGLDASIMKAVGDGVPVYCISPDDKVSEVIRGSHNVRMPLATRRTLVVT
jgi:hypothetical protein